MCELSLDVNLGPAGMHGRGLEARPRHRPPSPPPAGSLRALAAGTPWTDSPGFVRRGPPSSARGATAAEAPEFAASPLLAASPLRPAGTAGCAPLRPTGRHCQWSIYIDQHTERCSSNHLTHHNAPSRCGIPLPS